MNSLGRAERGGSTAGLKEFHNLLNNVEQTAIEEEGRSWRKYARLVLPHVGLVAFVCLYAIFGAWVFYSIESPHEDRLKVLGIRRVHELRKQMVAQVLASGASADQQQRAQWSQQMEAELSAFSEQLFKAYREQYVRYENVRPTGQQHAQSAQQQPPQTDPRFRRHFSKSRSDGKLWTPSSSLFFAATTMATIGYGNIVPVTNQGRIACIIFALFGAPLTIITIGDLGKFLSESIIWLYRDLREKYEYWGFRVSRFWIARRKKRKRRQMKQGLFDLEQGEVDEEEEEQEQQEQEQEAGGEPQANAAAQRNEQPKSVEDWEEHTDVPVLLVFAILLLYIALGGVLFAVLESWTYMDAFYYCFVSLTTIGFGDLVPDRHEYIVLMLIYLGFGLAVTTMCIDLVGIQYIQKIHYFGRKFQGTDILQILKRKRMLERRFAMGEGKDLFEYVIRQEREALFPSHQQKTLAQPVLHLANQALARDQPEEEKLSLRSDEPIVPTEEAQVLDVLPLQGLALAQQLCVPELLEPVPIERRVSSPSVLGTPPSETERLIMYEQLRREGRADSWAESGLTPSMASSTASTAPSVRQRQQLYENWRSPQPSLSSFAFTFPPPSPDLAEIAEAARASRRLASCPEILPQPVSSASTAYRRKWHSLACPPLALRELLRFSTRCVVQLPLFQSIVRKLSSGESPKGDGPSPPPVGQGNNGQMGPPRKGQEVPQHVSSAVESIHHADLLRRRVSFWLPPEVHQAPRPPQPRFRGQPVWYCRRRRSILIAEGQAPQSSVDPAPTTSAQQSVEVHQPVLKRKKRERKAKQYDPLSRVDWLALSPRIAVDEKGIPRDFEEMAPAKSDPKLEEHPALRDEHPAYSHLFDQPPDSVASFSFDLSPLPMLILDGSSTSPFHYQKRRSLEHVVAAIQHRERDMFKRRQSLPYAQLVARRWREVTAGGKANREKRQQQQQSMLAMGPMVRQRSPLALCTASSSRMATPRTSPRGERRDSGGGGGKRDSGSSVATLQLLATPRPSSSASSTKRSPSPVAAARKWQMAAKAKQKRKVEEEKATTSSGTAKRTTTTARQQQQHRERMLQKQQQQQQRSAPKK